MGERKVQAKYYPPDFDPSKLPRIKRKRQNDDAVRFMLPMSVRCETCGEFMGTGLKFNSRKSDTGEDYLGIRIFRFSMKCKSCPATFTIKTDPKNSDYVCESGVRRNYEPWNAAKEAETEALEERQRQDEDTMQALENKTKDAKQEMDELDALDELKSLKARRASVNIDEVLARGKEEEAKQNEQAEREMLVEAKRAFERKRKSLNAVVAATPAAAKIGLGEKSDPREQVSQTGKSFKEHSLRLSVVKRIKKSSTRPIANAKASAPALSLVGYDVDSDSDLD